MKGFSRDPAEPFPDTPSGRKGPVGGLFVAIRGFDCQPGLPRILPENVDDTAHLVRAIKTRSRSLKDFYSANFLPRYSIPIYPSAKRIVEGDSVCQHERAASAARPYPSQCHALAGWIGCPASGPAKETEEIGRAHV